MQRKHVIKAILMALISIWFAGCANIVEPPKKSDPQVLPSINFFFQSSFSCTFQDVRAGFHCSDPKRRWFSFPFLFCWYYKTFWGVPPCIPGEQPQQSQWDDKGSRYKGSVRVRQKEKFFGLSNFFSNFPPWARWSRQRNAAAQNNNKACCCYVLQSCNV